MRAPGPDPNAPVLAPDGAGTTTSNIGAGLVELPPAGLIRRITAYDPKADVALISRAYEVAARAHATQKRDNGDPYITHPLAVAGILTGLRLDAASIVTGLLHDTIEDTAVNGEAAWKCQLDGPSSGWSVALTERSIAAFPSPPPSREQSLASLPLILLRRDDGQPIQRLLFQATVSDLTIRFTPKGALVATQGGLWALGDRQVMDGPKDILVNLAIQDSTEGEGSIVAPARPKEIERGRRDPQHEPLPARGHRRRRTAQGSAFAKPQGRDGQGDRRPADTSSRNS